MDAIFTQPDRWNSAVRAAIPAIVAIVFVVCRRWLPTRPKFRTTAEDEKRFGRLQWALGAAVICVAALFGASSYYFLFYTNRFLAIRGERPVLLLLPTPYMWAAFSIFGAICCSWEITFQLWKRFGNPTEAQRYQDYSSSKAGFDTTRVLRLMIIFLALPAGIATALALPIHTSLREESICIGHFGTLRASIHSYSDIQRIIVTDGRELRDGSFYHQPAVILYFADGSRWNSADNREPDSSIASLAAFIESRTTVSAEYLSALPFGSK